MSTQELLSENVRTVMRLTGETQKSIARVLEIPPNNVNVRINNRVRWTMTDMDRLSAHWGLEPRDLLLNPQDILRTMVLRNGAKVPVQPVTSAA